MAIVCVVKNVIRVAIETRYHMRLETCCGDAKTSVIEFARFVMASGMWIIVAVSMLSFLMLTAAVRALAAPSHGVFVTAYG